MRVAVDLTESAIPLLAVFNPIIVQHRPHRHVHPAGLGHLSHPHDARAGIAPRRSAYPKPRSPMGDVHLENILALVCLPAIVAHRYPSSPGVSPNLRRPRQSPSPNSSPSRAPMGLSRSPGTISTWPRL